MKMNHMSSYQNATTTKVRLGRLMILIGIGFLIGFAVGIVSGYALNAHITAKYGTETNEPINYQEEHAEQHMTERR